jgi:protein-histidine N-methyltransferase
MKNVLMKRSYIFLNFILLVVGNVAIKEEQGYAQDESTKAFLTWFKDMGGKATGVTVGISEDMGRGVFAVANLSEDDPVLSVPLSMCMCRDSALHDKSKRVRKAYKSLRDDEDLVALFILREISKGSKSKFEPYLNVLPKQVPLTSFFTENELKALQDKRRISDAKRRTRQLKNRYKKLSRQIKDLFKDIPEKKRRDKYNDYAWAVAVVGSRALSMSGTKYLVPFADMFNYAPHHEEREANNGAEFLRYHKVQGGNFNVFADRACKAGAQLVEDYGDNTNSLYINHHGFVVEENPFDCVELEMPKINRKEKLRYKLATRMHLNSRPPVCIQPSKKNLPKVLTDHFKALAFPDDWVDKCLKWLGKDSSRQPSQESYDKCFSNVDSSIMSRSRRLFHDALKQKLKSYPTTYDQDKLLLESSEKADGGLLSVKLNYHEIVAIKYRMAQKRLLSLLMVEHGAKIHAADGGNNKAASNKEKKVAEMEQQKSDEKKAKAFNEWFATFNAPINKIEAQAVPGMRIGTMTTEHVKAEEVYLAVPEEALMDSDSAHRCDVLGPMFESLKKKHPRGDKFHELLIHLIYERFVRNTDSFWWPYLNVIPALKEMHAPAVAFSDSELDELRGSEVFDAIQAYKDKLRRKYKGVNKHLFSKYKKILPPEVYTYDNYR